MKFSRRRIKFGKFVINLPVHASYCADCLSEPLARGGRDLGLSSSCAVPGPSICKVTSPSAWPMSPTEPVPRLPLLGRRLSMTQTTTNTSSKPSAGRSRSAPVVGVVGRTNVFFIAIAAAPSWN